MSSNNPPNPDYDLSTPIQEGSNTGLRQGLTSYGDAHFSLFLRKVFIKALGYSEDALSRPIVGVVNTQSGFNPCHASVPQLIDAVRRGVQLAGGLAVDFPTISLHESFASPTSMYLRNLMSMDTEEMIRAQPCDAVVLIGGCDKTTPAQLMGGISANKPILHLVTGPMMPGSHRGVRIGACTDCRNNWAKFRAGEIDMEDISAINDELAPTAGTCGVMGTASTMACILVALGLMPFAGASAPAVSSSRLRIAEETGKFAVAACKKENNLQPQALLSRESFLNAITVLQAIGGSTNAVVHLMAIIGRHPTVAGTITLKTVDEIGQKTPLLVDLKPSGENYMTDFHNSGGMLALLHQVKPLLHLEARTYTGQTLGEELARITPLSVPQELSCIQPFSSPLYPRSSLVILTGNLAPGGAIIKASASKERRLLQHRGRAVVFAGSADLARRIDDPDLAVTPDSVLVLQNIGPVGNPGMPEAGMIPIPRKLAACGVADMLRMSDGRMSGTAGGTIALHISPEADDPSSVLGVVRTGDWIVCDVERRLLEVDIPDEEIARRIRGRAGTLKGAGTPWNTRHETRGYRGLYLRSVNQAQFGADFDFLTASGPV
ncbi:Dihydroxy-acid/6-phosphogluconate dehydratase [Cordyceps fumosorosea ARSEF 2679]|uniref:Dihydroxy-acid/6-phosphogluconate dehydratase n=1 Tax=Cordyceps fumosorosea (strain ARSEF 2679) TaxID=1081104 RepID=A0A167LY37_CORFA|nr:Dihydroxy-acid/6-phosphogluconate dehydratase [Cordyceps fumosorosea ARSEF 2679]OAA53667.1 Dihydroxy-acid/6-phosphogluconate dehydratase [Cordyceps fumosorosea ARSEF 2679]